MDYYVIENIFITSASIIFITKYYRVIFCYHRNKYNFKPITRHIIIWQVSYTNAQIIIKRNNSIFPLYFSFVRT